MFFSKAMLLSNHNGILSETVLRKVLLLPDFYDTWN